MRALQDFSELDKLQIQMNDVITVIEGRFVFFWKLQLQCDCIVGKTMASLLIITITVLGAQQLTCESWAEKGK